ncbi:MAG: response regulator transcription factor [Proteobacteria bacterium]|nr:response regulator transcription factor [Pseudomonadota bacterium]
MLSGSNVIEVVGEAANGAEAVTLVGELKPDVLLLDITMPIKDGIEATTDIAAMNVPTKILILSMHSDEQYALRTLRAGASGFISKGARLEELLKAITEVKDGNRYLPDHIAKSFAEKHIRPDSDKPLAELLSKREFQVMNYLASGMTNREIAKLLDISVKTVDTHRGHVLKKLKLRNNSDITRFAIQHGYIHC